MSAPDAATAQQQWKDAVLGYAQAINRYVEAGLRDGWDQVGDAPPMSKTDHLLQAWRAALHAANRPGAGAAERAAFRADWPPAHAPLIPLLKDQARSIDTLCLLADGTLIARIGAPYEPGFVVQIRGDGVTRVDGVEHFGRCPARRFFALAQADGVRITDGWGGPTVASCPWPSGHEDLPPLPEGFEPPAFELPAKPTALVPFPDGRRVLLVCDAGIFVLAPQGATRLLPSQESLAEEFAGDDIEPEDLVTSLSMEHGAISPDGRWIALGSQDSSHHIFDAADLRCVATIGPVGEYPHFALFNRRSDHAIFNACHFYNGATLGVARADWPGMQTECYADDPRTPTLQDGARVYAGAHRGDEYIVGDAHGYLRAFSESGEPRWQHFIGSTIGAIDVSPDGKTLAVASCAGFICLIELDAGKRAPGQIGTGEHFEHTRWIFWKGEGEQGLQW